MICKTMRTSVNWQLTQVLPEVDAVTLGRQEQQTGFQEPVCGEARTEEPAAVRGEDRKESRSRCELVKETRKKEGALTLCGEARKALEEGGASAIW